MIVYKVDPQSQTRTNKEIGDMEKVLTEIPTTLKILQDLLKAHEDSLSTPTLDSYREDLQTMIPEAVRLTHLIAVYSQKLSAVSEQVSKQLVNFDNSIRSSLLSKTGQTQPSQKVEGTTQDHSGFRVFQRQS